MMTNARSEDQEKLREAIAVARKFDCTPIYLSPPQLRLLADAAESTLPKTKMVKVNSYRVEWACKNALGEWEARCDHYSDRRYALSRYESLLAVPECQRVRFVGPIVHEQEIPA